MTLKLPKYRSLEEFDRAREAKQRIIDDEVYLKGNAIKLIISGSTLKDIKKVLKGISNEDVEHLRLLFEEILG